MPDRNATLPIGLDPVRGRGDAHAMEPVANWRLHLSDSPRLKVAALAVCVAGAALGLMFGAGYAAGQRVEPELDFLSPGRAPNSGEAVIGVAMTYAISSRDYNDLVFLGDSTCEMGIDPHRLANESGLSAWNLGTMRGFGPYGFFLLASAYLQHHPAPKAVVLCVTPTLFECEPSVLDGEMEQRLKWSYAPEIGSPFEHVPFVAKRGAANSLSFWARDVRTLPLEGMGRETYFTLAAKTRRARGFLALPGERGPANGIPLEQPATLVRPEWDKGCRLIAHECELRGAKFLMILAPLIDSFVVARDWPQIAQWGKSLHSDHPCASITTPLFYKRELMYDALHLNARGVERFMPIVAKDVQAVLK